MPYDADSINANTALELPYPNKIDHVNKGFMFMFCLLSIGISVYPTKFSWRTRNYAALNMLLINDLICLFYFVNGCLWGNEEFQQWVRGYIWCDIQAALKFPLTMALACSLVRFTYGLLKTFSPSGLLALPAHLQSKQRWTKFWWDSLSCWGFPILQMALYFLCIDGRYDVLPVVGCLPDFDMSWPWLVLYVVPIPIVMIWTIYYAIRTIKQLVKWRRSLQTSLRNMDNTRLDAREAQFLRMVLMAGLLIIWYTPVQFAFFLSMVWGLSLDSYSLSTVHVPFKGTIRFAQLAEYGKGYQYFAWTSISWNIVIFIFFGLTPEAIDTYRRWLDRVGLSRYWLSLKVVKKADRPDLFLLFVCWLREGSFPTWVRDNWREFKIAWREEGRNPHICRQCQRSRTNPQVRLNALHPSNVTTNVLNVRGSIYMSGFFHPEHTAAVGAPPSLSVLQPVVYPSFHRPGGILNLFRTNIDLHTGIFSFKPKKKVTHKLSNIIQRRRANNNRDLDLEAQRHGKSTPVSSSIWSDTHTTLDENDVTDHLEMHYPPRSTSLGALSFNSVVTVHAVAVTCPQRAYHPFCFRARHEFNKAEILKEKEATKEKSDKENSKEISRSNMVDLIKELNNASKETEEDGFELELQDLDHEGKVVKHTRALSI